MLSDRIRGQAFRLAALVPLLAIAPLTLGPSAAIQENRACAEDVCVKRIGDVCFYNGNTIDDYYTKYIIQ